MSSSTKATAAGLRTSRHSGDTGGSAVAGDLLETISAVNRNSMNPCDSVCAARTGDAHRQFQRLFVVEPRVDGRAIGPREFAVRQAARAARTLRDVIAGQLEMHAAEDRIVLVVDAECGFDLGQDVVEAL